jgi:hypothetical protein
VHNKLWSRKVVEFGFGVHTVSFYYGNLNGCHIQKRTTFHSVESFLPMAPCDKLQVVENVNNNKRSKCGISKTQKCQMGFFHFPKNPLMQALWLENCDFSKSFIVKKSHVLCTFSKVQLLSIWKQKTLIERVEKVSSFQKTQV